MLYTIKDSNPSLRKEIYKHGNPDLIKCIGDVCLNTLNGNVKLTKHKLNHLKKYKNQMRELSSSNVSVNRKRKVLGQKGGFIPFLIGAVLSTIVGTLIDKYTHH